MKLLIMHFSPVTCYLLPLRPKYLPWHSGLDPSNPMFLPHCNRPSFIPIKKTCNIIVLYIRISTSLAGQKTNDSGPNGNRYSPNYSALTF